jgi:hypothetical protein
MPGDTSFDERELARPELLGAVGGSVVRAIGEKYRAMTRGAEDVESLRAAIARSRPWDVQYLGHRLTLGEQARADFEEGRTVVVNGWILSVTEARQCAIFSLLPG